MGLETVESVMEVGTKFGIVITDGAAIQMKTAGELLG